MTIVRRTGRRTQFELPVIVWVLPPVGCGVNEGAGADKSTLIKSWTASSKESTRDDISDTVRVSFRSFSLINFHKRKDARLSRICPDITSNPASTWLSKFSI